MPPPPLARLHAPFTFSTPPSRQHAPCTPPLCTKLVARPPHLPTPPPPCRPTTPSARAAPRLASPLTWPGSARWCFFFFFFFTLSPPPRGRRRPHARAGPGRERARRRGGVCARGARAGPAPRGRRGRGGVAGAVELQAPRATAAATRTAGGGQGEGIKGAGFPPGPSPLASRRTSWPPFRPLYYLSARAEIRSPPRSPLLSRSRARRREAPARRFCACALRAARRPRSLRAPLPSRSDARAPAGLCSLLLLLAASQPAWPSLAVTCLLPGCTVPLRPPPPALQSPPCH